MNEPRIRPSIDTARKALVSIRDRVERNGTIEGKGLLDMFSGPPFGWSPDTTRYLVAALLVAGEIKLKVSGREVTVNGQQAIDVLNGRAAPGWARSTRSVALMSNPSSSKPVSGSPPGWWSSAI
jgi:hypothetical protein